MGVAYRNGLNVSNRLHSFHITDLNLWDPESTADMSPAWTGPGVGDKRNRRYRERQRETEREREKEMPVVHYDSTFPKSYM